MRILDKTDLVCTDVVFIYLFLKRDIKKIFVLTFLIYISFNIFV